MRIPAKHLTALLKMYQARHGLAPDGIYGPLTASSLNGYLEDQGRDEPAQAATMGAMRRVFESAMKDVGEQESPLGSNMGPYVEGLRAETGLDRRGGGEWCALFVSAHARRNGVNLLSRGAPGVVRQLRDIGRSVDASELTWGTYGLSLHRRGKASHHVRIFSVYLSSRGVQWVKYVGGNERHRVVSERVPLYKYLDDVLEMSTI